MAAHLEIALSTVSNFCRGVRVSIAKFEEISDALGLDARTLIQAQGRDAAVSEAEAPPAFYAYDEGWVGRETWVETLQQQVSAGCRLLFITGIAGVGKTALAERLSMTLADWGPPLRENFDAQDQGADFASVAARWLEKLGQGVTPCDRADVPQLLNRLSEALQGTQRLVLIDSLEEILWGSEAAEGSEFQDPVFLQFFQRLLAAESCQSCVVVTTQTLPTQLLTYGTRYRNFWATHLLPGLSAPEQLALFAKTGLAVSPDTEAHSYLVRLGQAYEGHPLALRVIAGEMGSRPFYGNVVAYWQRYGQEIEQVEQAIAKAVAGQAVGAEDKWRLDRFTRTLRRNVRARLEQTFLRLRQEAKFAYVLLCEAAVYRCAVPEDWWLSHLDYWDCDGETATAALDALRDRFLVEEAIAAGQYTLRQHTLIRSLALDHFQHLDQLS